VGFNPTLAVFHPPPVRDAAIEWAGNLHELAESCQKRPSSVVFSGCDPDAGPGLAASGCRAAKAVLLGQIVKVLAVHASFTRGRADISGVSG
jgi:hypothetical protein